MRSYDEILSDLQKHERNHKPFVSVFNWSDSAEAKRLYRGKLSEYGIIQQEWLDNILKINKEEAGLKSFFEDSKTSNTLIKRKIFPNIESKLEENNIEKVEIQSLVRSYAKELVKNDKIIKDEAIYKNFLSDSIRFEEQVATLEQDQKNLERVYEESGKLRNGLQVYSKWASDQVDDLEMEKKENRKESSVIKFEEACYKYYKKDDAYKDLIHLAHELENKVTVLEANLRETQYRRDAMKAAQFYKEIEELRFQIKKKQIELNQVLAKEDDVDIASLMAVLMHKYNEYLIATDKRVKNLKSELLELGEDIGDLISEIRNSKEEIKTIRENISRKDLLIEQFEKRLMV